MQCPKEQCSCPDSTATKTYNAHHPSLKQSLRGLNVTRRQRKCVRCGVTFFTIELLEQDYERLAPLSPTETKARI